MQETPVTEIDSGHFAATSALFLFLPALHAWPCHPGRQETRAGSTSGDIVYLFELPNYAKAAPFRAADLQGHMLTPCYPEVYHQLEASWSARQLAHHPDVLGFLCFSLQQERRALDLQRCPITWK